VQTEESDAPVCQEAEEVDRGATHQT